MEFLSSLLDPTSVLLGGVVVLCVLWWLSTRRPPGLPPGPGPALPLLGHLHLLSKDPRPQFWRWRRQYGDVFSLYMGGGLTIVLSGYSAIREALVTFGDVFSNRPADFLMSHIIRNKGVVGSSGAHWKEQRKTALEILRQMGMGKNMLAEKIQEEVTHYIQAMKDLQGAPVDIWQMTQVSMANNIYSIAMGTRFDYKDPKLFTLLRSVEENLRMVAGSALLNYLPFLGYIPGDPVKKSKVLTNSEFLFTFIRQHVADHRKRVEEKGEVEGTDFIFSYLRHMQDLQSRGVVDTTLNDEGLTNCVSDLFIAGSDSTPSILLWTLLFFLHYPDVQDKCFQEISDVIGLHRPPSMSDRAKMTYLEATIYEVLRLADIGPLSGAHSTSADVTFRGYVIPKNTTVITHLTTVLHAPEIWGDPENFRPERLIGPDGKLTKRSELIPFGIGRRMCLGESVARMELFLYLTALIQHFRFLPAEEGQLPPCEGSFSTIVFPHPFKLRAVARF